MKRTVYTSLEVGDDEIPEIGISTTVLQFEPMTTAQIENIESPSDGMMAYDSDLEKIVGFSNNFWANLIVYYAFGSLPPINPIEEQVFKQTELLTLNATNTADLVTGGVNISSGDNSTISTYTDPDVLVQSNIIVSDKADGAWINGVNTTTDRLDFLGNTVNGTLVGILTTGMVGTIIGSNGFSLRYSSRQDGNQLNFDRLNGITDQEIIDNFSRPNILTFDFSRSLYAPDDVQGVIDLMGTATPPVTGLTDNTVQIPANDFVIRFRYRFDDESAVRVMLANKHNGDENNVYNMITIGTAFIFQRRNIAQTGNVQINLGAIGGLFAGRTFDVEVMQSAANGVTFSVVEVGGLSYSNSVSGTTEDFKADVPSWQNVWTVGSRDGDELFAVGVVSAISIEYLT